jgi:hypothetical protein
VPLGKRTVTGVHDVALPRIPQSILKPLQDCALQDSARYGDAAVTDEIQEVLGKLQIQHARLGRLFEDSLQNQPPAVPRFRGIDAIVDAAELHAMAERLFGYARDEKAIEDITFHKRMTIALYLSKMPEHSDLQLAIDRRASRLDRS